MKIRALLVAIEPPEPCPERDRLQELVSHCRKRVSRAETKLRSAIAEDDEATSALIKAEQRLARWLEEHPDPQGSLI